MLNESKFKKTIIAANYKICRIKFNRGDDDLKKENKKRKKLSVVVMTPLTKKQKEEKIELLRQMFQEKYYS